MTRDRKLFTIGSIVSMFIMLMASIFGFFSDAEYYHTFYGYPEYYYMSFSDIVPTMFWILFGTVLGYVVLGTLATIFYGMHFKTMNISNMALTLAVYVYAVFVCDVAFAKGHFLFGYALVVAVCVGLPIHIAVEILALKTKRIHSVNKIRYSISPKSVGFTPANINDDTDSAPSLYTVEETSKILKHLKELHDTGMLSKKEYEKKKKKYLSQI